MSEALVVKEKAVVGSIQLDPKEDERQELAKELGNPFQWLAGRGRLTDGNAIRDWLKKLGCKHESSDLHYFKLNEYPGYLPYGAMLVAQEAIAHGCKKEELYIIDPELAKPVPVDPMLVYHVPGSGGPPWKLVVLHEWDLEKRAI